jgi:phospholipid/cholesterol/gamma-HCH transport system substrate-binding protein
MESKNKRSVTVGLFVFFGLVILIAAILTLGGQKNMFAEKFSVRARFDDVSGLQKGNNIWYAGVKVGIVKDITFDEKGLVNVEMSIDEKSRNMIRKDMKAKVGSEGLIGNRIIVIFGGSQSAPLVQNGDELTVEKAMSTDDMMATLQENNKNILDITTDFKTVSERLAAGEGSIGMLLKDETMANDLQVAMISLRNASRQAQGLTEDLAAYASKLQNKGSLTNDLVTDTVIFSRLRATARQIDELSKTANAAVNNLNTATRQVNEGMSNVNTPVGVLLNDKVAAADLKATISNLSTGTKKLDENLKALQHNFLLRGFFKKREKEREKLTEKHEALQAGMNKAGTN